MLFLSGFNQTSQFGDILGKNSKCGISWKLVRWKVAIFHADRPIFMKLFKNIMRVAVFLLRQETRLNKDSSFRQLECITLLLILTLLGCDCSSGKCPRRFVCLSQNTWIWTQQQQQRHTDLIAHHQMTAAVVQFVPRTYQYLLLQQCSSPNNTVTVWV